MNERSRELIEWLGELNPDALLWDGFEDALVGVAQQFNTYLALYHHDLMVQICVERDGMGHMDALEHLEFNVLGGWLGPNTPVVLLNLE